MRTKERRKGSKGRNSNRRNTSKGKIRKERSGSNNIGEEE
jgi:hypothetical protein